MPDVAQLSSVSRFFDRKRVAALDSVDLTIRKGETVAIMGRSGSGKTTLLNILGALDFPSSGETVIFGTRLNRETSFDAFRNRHVGFVFQLHHLIPNLTLEENVMLPMFPLGLPKSEMAKRAKRLLSAVELENRSRFLPVEVSGGERQRTAIARALANDPALILADEPTGNLDSETSDSIIELLLDLAKNDSKTLIIATHDSSVSEKMAREIRLLDGRISSDTVRKRDS